MNKIIYDIRKDKHLKKLVLEQEKYLDSPFYKLEYGVYGSSEWFDNVLKADGVAKSVQCILKSFKKRGKSTLDMIRLSMEGKDIDLIAKGDFTSCKIGQQLLVILCDSEKIFSEPTSGWELIYCELA